MRGQTRIQSAGQCEAAAPAEDEIRLAVRGLRLI